MSIWSYIVILLLEEPSEISGKLKILIQVSYLLHLIQEVTALKILI